MDGTPRSSRWADVYRSASGGLEQALQVFLGGCGLPAAWAGQRQWRILETGFGLGLNFLAAWQAWRDDARRPGLLHFASIEGFPVAAADLLRSARAHRDLQPLADELAAQWWGLVPGVHRLVFEGGRVTLTLCVGDVGQMLRELAFAADSVFLDGFSPARNPAMWAPPTLQAVARLCRPGTRLATWTAAGQVRQDLAACGFEVTRAEGLPPKRHRLEARYRPGDGDGSGPDIPGPGSCIVVGGGLAGAAAAASLARRGWQVQVLDAAPEPAAGASSLPAGLMAPHVSADDNLLSRLSRCGVRISLQQARALLREGQDWAPSGALERRAKPWAAHASVQDFAHDWSHAAEPARKREGLLAESVPAVWHARAAWIQPAALVRAWLAQPGIRWRGGHRVAGLHRTAQGWQAQDAQGGVLAEGAVAVLAAALGSAALASGRLWLQPVRGQVSWAPQAPGLPLPPFALNGNGHFLPAVPTPEGPAWMTGSTYGRGDTDLQPRPADHGLNLDRLQALSPALGLALAPAFAAGRVRAWTGVRCASHDRRPLVGELAPGLWVSTAMGSRGLTFAALSGELLAARLHAEPLPLAQGLAAGLDVARQQAPAPLSGISS
ncbi:Conserved hypothetical protein [Ramlibacter tataouinensis TTB310]|uniref:tRNA 5-methylaminomethyl-2-thiouridine biosynthesis bifunctional protein MnmC n=1 Tax=Ramlibacter tataouinensis (strain ATCC BAA-407 / DSM 14655 / LMG 21543 / TTB310) TaxID=365046 RepID=F5XZZ6_RAMTT|nr:Conserved hypothetical protein [Ramlibacter tataouinensis TTB310]